MAIEDILVKFDASTSNFTTGVEEVKSQLDGVLEPINRLKSAFSEIQEALIAAFAVEAIVSFVEKIVDASVKLQHFSETFGITVQEASVWNLAAKENASSIDALGNAFMRFNNSLALAQGGSAKQAAAFNAMGVEITAQNGQVKTATEVWNEYLEAVSKFSGQNSLSAEMTITGRSIRELLPTLKELANNTDELREKSIELGTYMSKEMTQNFEAIHKESVDFGEAVKGVGITLITAFKPAIDAVITGLTSLIVSFNDSIKNSGAIKTAFTGIVLVLDDLIAGVTITAALFKTLWDGVAIAVQSSITGIIQLLRSLAKAMVFDFTGAEKEWEKGNEALEQIWKEHTGNMVNTAKDTVELIKKLLAGIGEGGVITGATTGQNHAGQELGTKDAGSVSPTQKKDSEAAIRAAEKEAEAIAKVNMDAGIALAAQHKKFAEDQLKDGQISAQAEIEIVTSAENEKYKAELVGLKARTDAKRTALTAELALEQQGSEKYKTIKGELLTLDTLANGEQKTLTIKHQTEMDAIRVAGLEMQKRLKDEEISAIKAGDEKLIKAQTDYELQVNVGKKKAAEQSLKLGTISQVDETAILLASEQENYDIEERSAEKIHAVNVKALNDQLAIAGRSEQEQVALRRKLETEELVFDGQKRARAEKLQNDLNAINAAGDEKIASEELRMYEDGIKDANRAASDKESIIKKQYDAGLISLSQETTALRNAENERYKIVQDYYRKIGQLEGLSVDEHKKFEREKVQDTQQATQKQSEYTIDQYHRQEQALHSFIGTFVSSFGNAIEGAITKQTTWADAWRSIMRDMIKHIVQMIEEWITNWAVGMLLNESASKAAAVGTIGASAAEAGAAGVASAAAIPMYGWEIAPAAGETDFDAAMAFAPLAGLAVGAWNIPSDMAANLHQGEMVIPQTFAQGMRDGEGLAGGDHYSINIQALDSKSISQLFMTNGSALVNALAKQKRNGAF